MDNSIESKRREVESIIEQKLALLNRLKNNPDILYRYAWMMETRQYDETILAELLQSFDDERLRKKLTVKILHDIMATEVYPKIRDQIMAKVKA